MSDHCAASEVPGAPDCHCGSSSSKTLVAGALRVALAGAPNAPITDLSPGLSPGRFYRREEWEMLGLPQPIRRLLLAGPPAVGLF